MRDVPTILIPYSLNGKSVWPVYEMCHDFALSVDDVVPIDIILQW